MKKAFIGLFCVIFTVLISSCQPIIGGMGGKNIVNETYLNTVDEKVFRFGNTDGGNVLLVIGMDMYINRIVNAQGQSSPYDNTTIQQKIVNYCNANTLNTKDETYDLSTAVNYEWKNVELSCENFNFTVIVTNNEENILNNIVKYSKEKNIIFDYFIFGFHGSADGFDSDFEPRALFRCDLMQDLDKIDEVSSCFDSNCSAISFSCDMLGDCMTIPLAVFFKTITGIENFSASKTIVCEDLSYPELIYSEIGIFEKVSDVSVEKLKNMSEYYKKYVSVDNVESYYGYNYYYLTINVPKSVLSEENDKNVDHYNLIGYYFYDGDACTSFYKNSYSGLVDVIKNQYPWDDIVISNDVKKISADYSEFMEFFLDVHAYDEYQVKLIDE